MQTQKTGLDFKGQNIFVGIDVHLKSWAVTILTENLAHKTFTQPACADTLSNYLNRNFPCGDYYSVYEAGFSGFWTHYKLKEMGINTKRAFCSQRSKLKALFFEAWNQWLISNFYHYYGDKVKRWRNFRVLAVDGSTAYLINKKDVVDYFGTQDNQHVCIPMARIMQVQDILNDLTVWGQISPIKESEQAIMAGHVSRLYEDSLTLFDRGYPGFALMYLMNNQEVPRHFVMRCKAVQQRGETIFAKQQEQ